MNDHTKESSAPSLEAVIDRCEGVTAVLRLQDGQELRLPIQSLPDGIQEGGTVRMVVTTAASEEEERERIARTMLNELLKKAE